MTKSQAIHLALSSMAKETKRLAVQANLHDMYGSDDVHCVNASKRRKRLNAAADLFEAMLIQEMLKPEKGL